MTLFRLPIYSETWDQLKPKIEKRTEKQLETYFYSLNLQPGEEDKLWFQNRVELDLGRGCDYNRAVGWVDISLGKTGLLYRVYAVDSRRKKPKNRVLRILTQDECITWHAIKVKDLDSYISVLNQIEEILDYIMENCHYFKGCFIEKCSLTDLAPYIDWNKLISG